MYIPLSLLVFTTSTYAASIPYSKGDTDISPRSYDAKGYYVPPSPSPPDFEYPEQGPGRPFSVDYNPPSPPQFSNHGSRVPLEDSELGYSAGAGHMSGRMPQPGAGSLLGPHWSSGSGSQQISNPAASTFGPGSSSTISAPHMQPFKAPPLWMPPEARPPPTMPSVSREPPRAPRADIENETRRKKVVEERRILKTPAEWDLATKAFIDDIDLKDYDFCRTISGRYAKSRSGTKYQIFVNTDILGSDCAKYGYFSFQVLDERFATRDCYKITDDYSRETLRDLTQVTGVCRVLATNHWYDAMSKKWSLVS